MSDSLEIIGVILIFCGIIYTFLRGMGKLPVGDVDEVESKILKIKGGPGIILVGLGIILFLAGSITQSTTPSETSTHTLTSTYTPETSTPTTYIPTPISSPISRNTPMVTTYTLTVKVSDSGTYNSVSGASVYLDSNYEGTTDYSGEIDINGVSQGSHLIEVTKSGYKSASEQSSVYSNDLVTVYIKKTITSDYLVGDWSYTSPNLNEVVRVSASGTFALVDADPLTGNIILSTSGSYQLTGSTLTVIYINGVVKSFSFTYIDQDTMELDTYKYTRIKY